jgi:hypothetical protein
VSPTPPASTSEEIFFYLLERRKNMHVEHVSGGLQGGECMQEQEWKQLRAEASEAVLAELPTIPNTSLEECIVRTVFVRGACQMVVQLEAPSAKTIEVVTARVFMADAAVALGHNALITRQREISRQLGSSVFVPMTAGVLRSFGACAEILATSGSATLSQLLASAPLDVASTQFLVAGIVVRLPPLVYVSAFATHRTRSKFDYVNGTIHKNQNQAHTLIAAQTHPYHPRIAA